MTRPTQVPLGRQCHFRVQDCHLLWSAFPSRSANGSLCNSHVKGPSTPQRKTSAVWAVPISLAATEGIDFSFSSTGYLDVSVHRVSHLCLCIRHKSIREPRDKRSFVNSPRIIADFHALHRLLTPRHPPCALSSLTTNIQNSPANFGRLPDIVVVTTDLTRTSSRSNDYSS